MMLLVTAACRAQPGAPHHTDGIAVLQGRFDAEVCGPEVVAVAGRLVAATQALWARVAPKMLPTPAKFHYLFNMRDISKARTFSGICPLMEKCQQQMLHL